MQRLLAGVGREHALGEVGGISQVPAGGHGQQRIGRRRPRVRVGELGCDFVCRQLAHARAAVRPDLAAVEGVRRLDEGDRHPFERGLEVGLRLRRVVERQVAVVLRRGDRTPEQPPPVLVEEGLRAGPIGGGAGRARQDRRERRPDQRRGQRLRGVHVIAGLLRADLREPVVVEAVRRDATARQRRRPLALHLGEDVVQRVLQLAAGHQPQERPPRRRRGTFELEVRVARARGAACCRRCRCRRSRGCRRPPRPGCRCPPSPWCPPSPVRRPRRARAPRRSRPGAKTRTKPRAPRRRHVSTPGRTAV